MEYYSVLKKHDPTTQSNLTNSIQLYAHFANLSLSPNFYLPHTHTHIHITQVNIPHCVKIQLSTLMYTMYTIKLYCTI